MKRRVASKRCAYIERCLAPRGDVADDGAVHVLGMREVRVVSGAFNHRDDRAPRILNEGFTIRMHDGDGHASCSKCALEFFASM